MTEIIWSEIIPEVERHVSANAKAKAAIEVLVERGCDRQRILRALYMYCGGSSNAVRNVRKDFRRKRGFILTLAKRLETRVVPDIKNAEHILDDAGFAVSSSTIEAIDSYTELLGRLANAVLKHPSSGRITGRDHHLKFLAEMVKLTTGRQHYTELAHLTAAVRFGYTDEPGCPTAESIGRVVRGQGPLDFEYALELQELRAAAKRP